MRAIGLEGARITVEILIRAKLQAVDENAGDNRIAVRARLSHQRQMTRVQVAHGRYENDASALLERVAEFRNGSVDLHRKAFRMTMTENEKKQEYGGWSGD